MPYSKKTNSIFFLLSLFIGLLHAQTFPSKHLSTKDGLPNNQVETILKDSRGILWVGTNNGVSKIEHQKFTNFYEEDGLAHNSAWDIIEDHQGTIWIASYGGGVTKFDGKAFSIFNTENGLVNDFVRKLFEFKELVFIGTNNGLSFINTKNDSITTIETEVSDFQVMDFFVYEEEIYCGTFRKGIFKIDIENKEVTQIFDYQGKFLFATYLKGDRFFYSIDNLGFGKKGALREFTIDSLLHNKKEEDSFGKSIIWEFAEDNSNNLYGAAWGVHSNDGGLYQIKDNSFINRSEDFGIVSPNVRCIYFDSAFNFLYVGTTDHGFYEVDLSEKITYFSNKELDIVAIEHAGIDLALLHTNGLTLVNNNKIKKNVPHSAFLNFTLSTISHNPQFFSDENTFIIRNKKSKDLMFYKILLKDDDYWISTNVGLFQLDSRGNLLNYYALSIKEFETDAEKNFLFPIPYTDFNIFSDPKNYKWHDVQIKPINFPASDPHTPVNVSSFVTSNDKIFIATLYKGLFLYQQQKFTSFNENNIFNELEINHLAIIPTSNTLVISTSSGAVFLADITKEFNILKKIESHLIQGNSIVFLETYQDYILIGTDKGLNIYKNGKIRFLDSEQGLKNLEFTSSKVVNDTLIIGTNTGYYQLDLIKILADEDLNLSLKIDAVTVNHKPLKNATYNWFNYNNTQLKLLYDQSSIDFSLKVVNHPYPEKLQFRYLIEELDTTWSKYTSNPNIYFDFLPIGKFHLDVQIKDLYTGKETTTSLMELTILPPFWKTLWFRILVAGTLVFVVFFVYHKRIRAIKSKAAQKSRIQKRLVETKMEALQSQMNPHFTFNAMNSIQNYIIDNDIDNALLYLGEFAKLIRKTLDNSSQPFITLAEEISYLKSYITLENMRFNNKVNIAINHQGLDIHKIKIAPMILQPFVENVFVHAFYPAVSKPKLNLLFSLHAHHLICKIVDNGRGITTTTSERMYQSKGLKLVRERLHLLNKTVQHSFEIASKPDKGTTVVIKLLLTQ